MASISCPFSAVYVIPLACAFTPSKYIRALFNALCVPPVLCMIIPPNYLAFMTVIGILGFRWYPRGSFVTILGYLTWMYLSDDIKNQPGHVWSEHLVHVLRFVMKSAMTALGCSCRIIMEFEPEYDSPVRYMCCYNPHGAFATAGLCFAMPEFRLHEKFRKLKVNMAGASILFYVPLLREILLILGVRDANKRTLSTFLRANHSIGLQPGGVWEQLHTSHTKEQCFCMSRLGFIRLAMAHGLPIVPVYAFGENSMYVTHDVGLEFRRWLATRFRIGVAVVTGRLGLPFPLIPNPTCVTIVSGKPIDVGPPTSDPSDAQLKEVFRRYAQELTRLFDAYKHECLPAEVAAQGLEVHWRGNESWAESSIASKS